MLTAEQRFRLLLREYDDYEPEAYNFVYEALDYTLKNLIGKRSNQHVTAHELLEGFKLYAIDQFGCLAKTVLNELRVRTTKDIGNIIFKLVEYELMRKQSHDKEEDFHKVYDFNKVFNLKPILSYLHEEKKWKVKYIADDKIF